MILLTICWVQPNSNSKQQKQPPHNQKGYCWKIDPSSVLRYLLQIAEITCQEEYLDENSLSQPMERPLEKILNNDNGY